MDDALPLRVSKAMAEADLVDLGVRLSRYAKRRMAYYRAWTGRAFLGKDHDDYAEEAIVDTYCGNRKWDPERHPELLSFLYDVVESKIRNAIWRKEGSETAVDDLPKDASLTPEIEWMLLDLKEDLADEPELWRIAQLYSEGVVKPADLAEALGVPIGEVHNRRKRLRRRVAQYLAEDVTTVGNR